MTSHFNLKQRVVFCLLQSLNVLNAHCYLLEKLLIRRSIVHIFLCDIHQKEFTSPLKVHTSRCIPGVIARLPRYLRPHWGEKIVQGPGDDRVVVPGHIGSDDTYSESDACSWETDYDCKSAEIQKSRMDYIFRISNFRKIILVFSYIWMFFLHNGANTISLLCHLVVIKNKFPGKTSLYRKNKNNNSFCLFCFVLW